ncbi:mandelate racemase/muconate lactonizing enzyme family protein [Actibacterium sp. 188UL27-1]|uniref:mandelate racemase/muconate lactonizing enzyme family protein n=1 Tax=Actibacterium sp. 188UL27-1 TaxID=2786961 RepID=UPI001956E567|nr:mandelate racemase/muconate lactonizing enzyme family protein [Actibacterium sp. 188UL27-1]MBM7069058.1 mandelate racemase/muconate lactonizing enzyme family protein [Actibacterium sp. 188UL27-1]
MKIAAIQTHILEHKLDTAFESASARFDHRRHLLVEVTCEDGTTGWGECLGPPALNAAVINHYKPVFLGADPLRTEPLWLQAYNLLRDQGMRGLAITALSGIDVALWDIKGKHFGMPVATLLGGRVRDSVRAYATGSFRRDGVDRVEDIAAEVADYRAQGFDAVKIKIGFDVAEDLRVIAAVRDAIGPDMALMIDANHGYDTGEAIALGQAAAPYDIAWFEEPVIPENLTAYQDVRAGQPIPVAGGETWHGRWAMQQALDARAVDILQPDLCGVGGFTEMRRVADQATLAGTRLVPHVWGTGVQIAASLQWMAAQLPDPPRPEARDPILEFDRTDMPFRQAILTKPLDHKNGAVQIPDAPGLGIEIDRAALDQYSPTP